MIKPVLQNETFIADVAEAARDSARLHLWWLGQSGFLVQWSGRHLLLDPYLSDSLTVKYAQTDKPHVRMTERVVPPESLDFIDVVTSSHNHTDHLDAETLLPIFRANPAVDFIIPEANREFVVKRLGVESGIPKGLNAGGSLETKGLVFHAVPAAHNELETDSEGRHKYLGYVIEFGPFRIYHSGDTKLFPGMEDWLRPFKVDLALLPINGDRPERRVAANLNGIEAATLAKEIGAGMVIPCHYDMFEFNTASPDAFVARANELGQPCKVLKCGERWTSDSLSS